MAVEMNVQADISLGAIINLAAIIFAAGCFYAMTKSLVKNVDEMKLELRKLNEVVTVQAVSTSRLDNLEERFNEMRKEVNGLRGIREGLMREAVDGEYPKR